MKCVNCGKALKRPYYFDNATYGVECWKKIALPEILRRRNAQKEEEARDAWASAYANIEVLKLKSLDKITSPFKLEFIPSIIGQFEDTGCLSKKQLGIIGDMFNGRDYKNYFRIAVGLGLNDKQNLIDTGVMKPEDF